MPERGVVPGRGRGPGLFQGLAISLMAGEVAPLLLSRMAVPVIYYLAMRHGYRPGSGEGGHRHPAGGVVEGAEEGRLSPALHPHPVSPGRS